MIETDKNHVDAVLNYVTPPYLPLVKHCVTPTELISFRGHFLDHNTAGLEPGRGTKPKIPPENGPIVSASMNIGNYRTRFRPESKERRIKLRVSRDFYMVIVGNIIVVVVIVLMVNAVL